VYYGAAMSEAGAYAGQDVIVVGGGNSAGQTAVHLARFARRVTMLVRGESLSASMSEYLVERIAAEPTIEIRYHTRVVDGGGDGRLEHVSVQDTRSNLAESLPAAGLFVFIGAHPHTDWLAGGLDRDRQGYLVTGLDRQGRPPAGWPLERPPLLLETSVPRVFAAGDVRHGAVKRVSSAVGEGALAVSLIHQSLSGLEA
jgi:thioredoxin reductase (NADPH)